MITLQVLGPQHVKDILEVVKHLKVAQVLGTQHVKDIFMSFA